jgi:hypothetical protein
MGARFADLPEEPGGRGAFIALGAPLNLAAQVVGGQG